MSSQTTQQQTLLELGKKYNQLQNQNSFSKSQTQETQAKIEHSQLLLGIIPKSIHRTIICRFMDNKKSTDIEFNSDMEFVHFITIINTKIEQTHYITYFDTTKDEVLIEDGEDLYIAVHEYLVFLKTLNQNEISKNPPLRFNLNTKNKHYALLKKNSINQQEKKKFQLSNKKEIEKKNKSQQNLCVTYKIGFSKQFPFRYIQIPIEMTYFELQAMLTKIFGEFSSIKFRDLEHEWIPIAGEDSLRYCMSEICASNLKGKNQKGVLMLGKL
ncbi:hypothetical protein M0812_18001 [Anaeramoeba flamelloides]|uniref:PB1 domain-containing protein n=1 Tax=Anaeramoeba flamelloides TaxID=1746091 RepID=A0AAV7Z258_9EUKA|nr:hypothetical protein M0812_18001 [Anaeramoeba flamelloides]